MERFLQWMTRPKLRREVGRLDSSAVEKNKQKLLCEWYQFPYTCTSHALHSLSLQCSVAMCTIRPTGLQAIKDVVNHELFGDFIKHLKVLRYIILHVYAFSCAHTGRKLVIGVLNQMLIRLLVPVYLPGHVYKHVAMQYMCKCYYRAQNKYMKVYGHYVITK